MAYVPTNMRIFLAAFSGALAGMNVSDRVLTDTAVSSYTSLVAIASAWAISFDGAWDSSTAPNVFQVQAVQEASEATWQQRSPILTVANIDSDTWDAQTAAIAALIRSADSYISGLSITPPKADGEGTIVQLTAANTPLNLDLSGDVSNVIVMANSTSGARVINVTNFKVFSKLTVKNYPGANTVTINTTGVGQTIDSFTVYPLTLTENCVVAQCYTANLLSVLSYY